jgi:hypothetical protein
MPQLVQTEENICTGDRCHWLLLALSHTAATVILLYHSYSNYFYSLLFRVFLLFLRLHLANDLEQYLQAVRPLYLLWARDTIKLAHAPSVAAHDRSKQDLYNITLTLGLSPSIRNWLTDFRLQERTY